MRTARFFVPEEWVAKHAEAFSIPAGTLHKQITLVLRLKVGDHISLMTGDGSELDALITNISRSAVMGTIAGSTVPNPTLPHITVCAAMTKRDTFEWMLQKCTELGAEAFIPLLAERVVKRPKETPRRWQDIVREAAEQSGRVTLPKVYEPMTVAAAIEHTKDKVRVFLHESGGDKKIPTLHRTNQIALFVGPEGGFSENEQAAAKAAKMHIVTLGDLVLRAETAAIVGTTLLRFQK